MPRRQDEFSVQFNKNSAEYFRNGMEVRAIASQRLFYRLTCPKLGGTRSAPAPRGNGGRGGSGALELELGACAARPQKGVGVLPSAAAVVALTLGFGGHFFYSLFFYQDFRDRNSLGVFGISGA